MGVPVNASWDFAGAEEHYATHSFFMSAQSLFMLCFSLADAAAEEADNLGGASADGAAAHHPRRSDSPVGRARGESSGSPVHGMAPSSAAAFAPSSTWLQQLLTWTQFIYAKVPDASLLLVESASNNITCLLPLTSNSSGRKKGPRSGQSSSISKP